MKQLTRTSMLAAAIVLSATSVAGAQAKAKHETEKELAAEAKIGKAAATKTALAQVPGGTVKSSELEREDGKLVYSFDIASKGKSGIDEVQVDAITGAFVNKVHETPAMEKKEAAAEKKEKKAMKP